MKKIVNILSVTALVHFLLTIFLSSCSVLTPYAQLGIESPNNQEPARWIGDSYDMWLVIGDDPVEVYVNNDWNHYKGGITFNGINYEGYFVFRFWGMSFYTKTEYKEILRFYPIGGSNDSQIYSVEKADDGTIVGEVVLNKQS